MSMPIEIERRFVPTVLPSDKQIREKVQIRQGYLAEGPDRMVVRVRQHGTGFVLTLKGGSGLAQTEVELPLTAIQFEALWPFTVGRRVSKTRCFIPLKNRLMATIDVYEGALEGRLVAEVEFESLDAAAGFDPPAWLGREVTEDGRYRAHALAQHGWPESTA